MPALVTRFLLLVGVIALSACAAEDLTRPPEPIGDFRLGYNIVVADKAQTVGPSRKATPEEWEALLQTEIGKRLGRYEGEKLYHVGVAVDAYALAVPGIPLVVSPKSVLALSVNIFDDTAGVTVNAEPKRFTVFERMSGETVVGSGLTQSREKQMQNLASNAARQITAWIVENKAWFTPEAVAARAAAAAAAKTAIPGATAPAATAKAVPAPLPAPVPAPLPAPAPAGN